jgi:hypothetical protein
MGKTLRQKIVPGRNPLLELCPFCGESAEIYCVPEERGCRVRCGNPSCSFLPDSKAVFETEELAVKAWNTRKGAGGDVKSVAKALLEETHDMFIRSDD